VTDDTLVLGVASMSRLTTHTKGMKGSDPFQRLALKIAKARASNRCGVEWPCRDLEPGETHVHRCFKHVGHGVQHKCNCGATKSERK
jgi:hypothetical protein